MKRDNIEDLKNISSFKYENIFDVIKENGQYYYNIYNTIQINSDEIDPAFYTEHDFSEGDYWTLLAQQYWGNTELWWIILITNNIQNPLELPAQGTKLKILKNVVISDIISSIT